jgi:hypothetical protein
MENQRQDLVGFVECANLAGLRHPFAKGLPIVLDIAVSGPAMRAGAESIELLDIHRPAALQALKASVASELLRKTVCIDQLSTSQGPILEI